VKIVQINQSCIDQVKKRQQQWGVLYLQQKTSTILKKEFLCSVPGIEQ